MFSINTVSAQSVCDPGCAFDFVFNNGGTLSATQNVTFKYAPGSQINIGDAGTMNVAVQPVSLDFSAGGVLTLLAGESITFDQGGSFNMAQGSDLSLFGFTVSGGNSTVMAGEKPTVITIEGAFSTDGSWVITSPEVNINSDITVGNGVSISNGGVSGATIIGGTGSINTDTLATIDINGSIVDNAGGLISIGDISLAVTNPSITVAGPITALEDLSGLQGMALPTVDEVTCIVKVNECIADNGDIYVLADSKLVKQQNNVTDSTAAGSVFALLMGFLLLLPRRFKNI